MEKRRIHYFQHVAFEGLGSIEEWASSNGHSLSSTRFFEDGKLPELTEFDWLIVMGGPMSVNDEDSLPWLKGEKLFIRQAIDAGKTVIGICLGSQLVSSALGSKVYAGKEKEIGWFDIKLTDYAGSGSLFSDSGQNIKVFHWHGDTFDLPENAIHLASSEAFKNQAYIYHNNVLALQFHLELTEELLNKMIENGSEELKAGNFIQMENVLRENHRLMEHGRRVLFALLNRLAGTAL